MKLVLVGARTVRQGTGPFLAAALTRAGAEIAGIVGTSENSLKLARHALRSDSAIDCPGFLSLAAALTALQPDAVAICSPWHCHREHLQVVADHALHCLVEKPMLWPGTTADANRLIDAFAQNERLLDMVAQWPTTLSAFAQLYGSIPARVDSFRMRLSPMALDDAALPDSAPHFISLLQALLGQGNCTEIRKESAPDKLRVHCTYHHEAGACEASLELIACPERPRPAWYEINSQRVDREVELPQYQQYLSDGVDRIAIEDPIEAVARRFLDKLRHGARIDTELLLAAHRNLLELSS